MKKTLTLLLALAANALAEGFCTDDGTCFKNDPEFFKHYTYYLYVEEKSIYLSGKSKKNAQKICQKMRTQTARRQMQLCHHL